MSVAGIMRTGSRRARRRGGPRMATNGARLVVLLGLTLLAGCGFFSRSKSRFFSLDPIPSPAAITLRGLPIGIDVVELPPGLDRREMVVRQPDLRLEMREREQWSAPLESLVLHTLAFNLASRLPDGMVVLPGQAKPAGQMRAVDVVFEDFAAGSDGVVVLEARWSVRDDADDRPDLTSHERITVDIASLDSSEIAKGMSQALAALADRIISRTASHR